MTDSERLESLGQLADGAAHQFNNLLTVIVNYAQFAYDELEDLPGVQADVREVVKAAEEATHLTHELHRKIAEVLERP